MFGRTLPLDGFHAAPLVNVDMDHAHGFEHGWQAAFEDAVLVLGVQMAGGVLAVFFGSACQRFFDRWIWAERCWRCLLYKSSSPLDYGESRMLAAAGNKQDD